MQRLVDAADLPSSYSLPSHAMETTDDIAFSSPEQGMNDDREASILPTETRTDAKVKLEADAASAPPLTVTFHTAPCHFLARQLHLSISRGSAGLQLNGSTGAAWKFGHTHSRS